MRHQMHAQFLHREMSKGNGRFKSSSTRMMSWAARSCSINIFVYVKIWCTQWHHNFKIYLCIYGSKAKRLAGKNVFSKQEHTIIYIYIYVSWHDLSHSKRQRAGCPHSSHAWKHACAAPHLSHQLLPLDPHRIRAQKLNKSFCNATADTWPNTLEITYATCNFLLSHASKYVWCFEEMQHGNIRWMSLIVLQLSLTLENICIASQETYIHQTNFIFWHCAAHVANQLDDIKKHQELSIMFQISCTKNFRSCSKSVGWITQEILAKTKKTFNHVPNQLDESHLLAKNTKNTFNHVLNHSWMNHPRTSCQEHYDFARTMESDSTARTRIFANGKFESPKNRMLWLWIATRKSHSHSLSFTKPTAHAYMYVSIHTAI